jgi:hypothetical protein
VRSKDYVISVRKSVNSYCDDEDDEANNKERAIRDDFNEKA